MHVEARTLAAAAAGAFTKVKTLLASSVRGLVDARARRREEEREFYRKLRAYCRANRVSPMCEDDWKTRA
jgi:hypothetical protein